MDRVDAAAANTITIDSAATIQGFVYRDLIHRLNAEDPEAAEKALEQDPCPGGWSLLHEACRRREERTVKALLDAGAEAAASDRYGWTPLHQACVDCGPRVVTVNAINGKVMPPEPGPEVAIAIALIERGADPDAEDEFGESPLYWAGYWKNGFLTDLLASHSARGASAEPDAEPAP